MPIKGITEKRIIPRLGKIRLGVMEPTKDGKGTRPQNVNYFVVPPEVAAVFGEKPTKLDVVLPSEDVNVVFPQYLKRYTYSALACKGDGEKAMETVVATGELKEMPCNPDLCEYYQTKKCKSLASLMFLIPSVPGMGVWQMDTTSYYGMVSINNSLELIRLMLGRIAGVPLELRRVSKTIMTREKGKQVKRDIETIELQTTMTLAELARLPANMYGLEAGKVQIEAPRDDDEPEETLTSDAPAEEPDTKTGEVKGYHYEAATAAQINSLKIILGQRAEAGIASEPIDYDKMSKEMAASEIKRLQNYKDKKPDDGKEPPTWVK